MMATGWPRRGDRGSIVHWNGQTEIIPGEKIIAICPLNRIGLHERNTKVFSVGMRRAFHLRRIEPIMLSKTPRLKEAERIPPPDSANPQ